LLITRALSPAKVSSVKINEETKTVSVESKFWNHKLAEIKNKHLFI
jgi:transcription antitermination factor NusA-like protein